MPHRVTRVGAYAVCVREGQILLVLQAAPGPARGSWTLPGGGLDFGESPAAAVVREVREETGGIAVIKELLGVHDNVYTSPDGVERHGVRLLYSAFLRGDLCPQGDGEITAIDWFAVDDLPRSTTPWAHLGAVLAVRPGAALACSATTQVPVVEGGQ